MSSGVEDLLNAFDGRMRLAMELAEQAGRQTLELFGGEGLQVEHKKDRSPVTEADRRAELLIRERLQASFPEDTILGEEFGLIEGSSPYRWVVDPIDGTKSFISGVPLYCTLVGLMRSAPTAGDSGKAGESLGGVIYLPALDELVVAAKGCGCWHRSQRGPLRTTRVSTVNRLEQGLFVTSEVKSFGDRGATAAYQQLEQAAYISRSWGDGYGYLLVATGRAEVMVDPIANPWDLAAVQPIIEEAGGTFSSWNGEPTVMAGDAVGSNGHVHTEVLGLLNQPQANQRA
jgi:histidinol phosphatase-like enzyme (inositol monophosphatase family)